MEEIKIEKRENKEDYTIEYNGKIISIKEIVSEDLRDLIFGSEYFEDHNNSIDYVPVRAKIVRGFILITYKRTETGPRIEPQIQEVEGWYRNLDDYDCDTEENKVIKKSDIKHIEDLDSDLRNYIMSYRKTGAGEFEEIRRKAISVNQEIDKLLTEYCEKVDVTDPKQKEMLEYLMITKEDNQEYIINNGNADKELFKILKNKFYTVSQYYDKIFLGK